MPDAPSRIVEDLAGQIAGDVRGDSVSLSMYATDASLYEITPQAVVLPRTKEDILATIHYARDNEIPLTPRGSGTGITGGALGKGIIIDTSAYFNQLIADDGDTVTVETGITLHQLNEILGKSGRYFAPDPANSITTTIGSMLAVDAAGSHALHVGSTRDHIRDLEMLLGDGSTFQATRLNLDLLSYLDPHNSDHNSHAIDPVYRTHPALLKALADLLIANESLIDSRQPYLPRNCSGYYLRQVLQQGVLDLPRFLVGSEGTLGLFTQARLHVSRKPEYRGMVLFFFDQLASAAQTINSILEHQPTACDLMDRRLLNLARTRDSKFQQIIPAGAEAAVIVEQIGLSDLQMKQRLSEIFRTVRKIAPLSSIGYTADDEDDIEFLWSLPRKVVPMLSRLKGELRPLPFMEDIAIKPHDLDAVLSQIQKVFQKHQVTSTLYSHAGSGQLHFRPFIQHPALDGGMKMEAIARDVYQVVFDFGGTISGEHGDGLSRTSFIRSQYGQLYRVFQDIKHLFDPLGIMNPDKIISNDPHLTRKNLRLHRDEQELVSLELSWDPNPAIEVAQACNGCGVCKTRQSSLRMCPFYRDSNREVDAPRSKGNVLRQYLQGQLNPEHMTPEEFEPLIDSCFNCKQCQQECPSQVDIPHLHTELKAAYVNINGQRRAEWYLARIHKMSSLACRIPFFANLLLNHRYARWLVEKLVGLSSKRRLPRYQSKPFLDSYATAHEISLEKQPLHQSVVYFTDYYAHTHDPLIGVATLRLLASLGIDVIVPADQTVSGMGFVTNGDLSNARKTADYNLRTLGEYAREGYTIITTEPSAAIALKKEYPQLSSHPDVHVLAEKTIDAGEFLLSLLHHKRDQLQQIPLKLSSLNAHAYYHTPCHTKALWNVSPYIELLGMIPELTINTQDHGCSGMAGIYGLSSRNFERSIRMGRDLIDTCQKSDYDFHLSECSSCKMQMEQASTTNTFHPLKLLAHSAGLLAEWEPVYRSRKTTSFLSR